MARCGLRVEPAKPYFDSDQPRNRIVSEIQELVAYRDLIRNLVRRNVTARYKRSVLGVLWTLLDPLATMIIMAVVFGALFARPTPGFPVFILSALIVWNFFSQASTQAMGDFLFSRSLIVQVYMPKSVFAFSAVGTGLVNLLIACGPLLVFMLIFERPMTAALLFIPLSVLLSIMFTLGVGLLISALAVFFADMLNIYQIALRLLMFLSGIFFSVDSMPEALQPFIGLIPTYQMVTLFRAPLYAGELPPLEVVLQFSGWAVLTLIFGLVVFTRLSDEYAYRV
jgi:ABC-type polysaccharide/polyol phosphate export permease